MSAKSRQLQKRLDASLRALTQIECIANATLERHKGDSDVHWIIDGIADLAHYAIEVADDPPRQEGADPAQALADESVFPLTSEPDDDTEADDQGTRRSH
jgi:hypothetical protein